MQNAEVCHVGDCVRYVVENIKDNEYYAFDVCALSDVNVNNLLYKIQDMTYDNLERIKNLAFVWYQCQHLISHNRYIHFLAALTKQSFDKIKGFDIDFGLGIEWDDDDFVFRIRNNI